MILADIGVWIDHFRGGDAEMGKHLSRARIAIHPFVVAELSLGSLADRGRTLATLEMLPQVQVATLGEVRSMIEAHSFYSKGIGLMDAHLLASTLLTPSLKLWTRDKRLRGVAEMLGIDAGIA